MSKVDSVSIEIDQLKRDIRQLENKRFKLINKDIVRELNLLYEEIVKYSGNKKAVLDTWGKIVPSYVVKFKTYTKPGVQGFYLCIDNSEELIDHLRNTDPSFHYSVKSLERAYREFHDKVKELADRFNMTDKSVLGSFEFALNYFKD